MSTTLKGSFFWSDWIKQLSDRNEWFNSSFQRNLEKKSCPIKSIKPSVVKTLATRKKFLLTIKILNTEKIVWIFLLKIIYIILFLVLVLICKALRSLPRNNKSFLSNEPIYAANTVVNTIALNITHCYFLLLYIHIVMTITNGQDLEHGVHSNVMPWQSVRSNLTDHGVAWDS